MTVASATIGGTCASVANSPALTVGATSLNLTVPSLPAGGCSVTIQVTSTTQGSNPATLTGATSTESSGSSTAPPTTYLTIAEDPGFHYVHADHLNTPRAITRPSDNALVWKWDNTEPFGNSQPNQNPSGLGVFEYNLRFPGQYYDQETGTSQNWHRDYDSGTGRYRQSDPIGLNGGLNTYGYVRANPLKLIDPKGLFEIDGSCCGKNEELRTQIENSCRMVSANIKNQKLRDCLEKRCKSGKVSCDGTMCWVLNKMSSGVGGWQSRLYGDNISLCVNANTGLTALGLWGCIAVHEWAHSCGWGHGDGAGVPEESDVPQGCQKSWNPTPPQPKKRK